MATFSYRFRESGSMGRKMVHAMLKAQYHKGKGAGLLKDASPPLEWDPILRSYKAESEDQIEKAIIGVRIVTKIGTTTVGNTERHLYRIGADGDFADVYIERKIQP